MSATDWGRVPINADPTGGNPTFNNTLRIPNPAGSANLYPNFTAYKKFMSWDPSVPVTRAQFVKDRTEGMKQIEKNIQPLVKRVLRSGKIPYSSNYYGPGERGVHWRDPITNAKGFTPYSTTKPPPAGLFPSLANKAKSAGAGIGTSIMGAKTLMGASASSAFGLAPATSAALIAGSGAAGYVLGRGLNSATDGAIDRAAQKVWQPFTDLAYGVQPKPDPMRDLWLGIRRPKRSEKKPR